MKANEAPEKIYMNWVNYPLEEMQVEYIRTDAFIEKTCEFFAPYISDNSGGYERAAVIEDFKNYIKGE